MGGSLELKAHDKSLTWAPKTIKTMKTMKHVGLGLELHLSVSLPSSILQPRWDFCAPGWVHPSCYQVPPRTTHGFDQELGGSTPEYLFRVGSRDFLKYYKSIVVIVHVISECSCFVTMVHFMVVCFDVLVISRWLDPQIPKSRMTGLFT